MTGYKMNFATKTLTITKAFAELAMRPNTAEANLMVQMRTLIPDLKISYRTHSGVPHPYRGLTNKRMETYIKEHKNADDLMVAFKAVKKIAEAQMNPHNYVCKWFLRQFPDYREIPKIDKDGKIVAVPVITLPEAEETSALELVA